jgi:hypothetical protein
VEGGSGASGGAGAGPVVGGGGALGGGGAEGDGLDAGGGGGGAGGGGGGAVLGPPAPPVLPVTNDQTGDVFTSDALRTVAYVLVTTCQKYRVFASSEYPGVQP